VERDLINEEEFTDPSKKELIDAVHKNFPFTSITEV